ncbi:hypothetical protein CWI80_06995 [Pseudidiomarina sediminum]|uniref:DUF2157 domain-containing protein n=1 Tax=Pseudidiomarina sediminum TaxID=431675 RepID=A0A432ZAT1_9GAMM|nr:hypothetical protein [Pseudidiomarina sediminum]RUO75066.1 hypothetical protein CWI80_06995 [Pseudidiomarina sediminum]
MYTDHDVNAAVSANIISQAQADALRQFVESERATQLQDEEYVRFVSGFNDIFVVIAAGVALAALWSLGNLVGAWLGGALVATTSWGLAEYFTRKRQMALPSIFLLLTCLGGVFLGTVVTLTTLQPESAFGPIAAFALSAIVAIVHWFRFRVPITLAAILATSIGVALSLLVAVFAFSEVVFKLGLFSAGVITFILALRWDRSDVARQTRRADVAFWLHLLAAPLLVHPIFVTLAGATFDAGYLQAGLTILGYAVLAMISLIIDRRALMISALSYVIYVFSKVLASVGLIHEGTAVIGLVIGAGLLLLSVFWHPLRRKLVQRLPQRFAAQVPAAH